MDWDKQFEARVRQAGGDPQERINGLPRFSMSLSGQIFDSSRKDERGKSQIILGSFSETPTMAVNFNVSINHGR